MKENPLISYGLMLKGFREDNYLTQQEVAEVLDVTKMTISNWENARRIPNRDYRNRLRRLYNMPPEADLLGCLKMYSKDELVEILMSFIDKGTQ